MSNTESGSGYIEFFEGNDCTEDRLGSVPYLAGGYNLRDGQPIPNDEARSLRLVNVKRGVIKLFDTPGGKVDADWTEILVLADVSTYSVGTFNIASNDGTVQVIPHGGNLDGKVSHIDVLPA